MWLKFLTCNGVLASMAKFDIDKAVSYWQEGAKYDWGVARALFRSRKYPHALFIGHLSLEEALKALFVKTNGAHAPFSHSLPYLAEKSGENYPEEILNNLREFMEFHFEARYPEATRAFYRKCTKPFAAKKMKEAEKILKWVNAKLRKL